MILLGKQIKELRNEAKLTQAALGEKLGVSKSTIAAYENDSRQPSYEVLVKMSNVFHVKIDALFFREQRDLTLSVNGLTTEQIHMLENIICVLRRSNLAEKIIAENMPQLRTTIDDCMNMRIYGVEELEQTGQKC